MPISPGSIYQALFIDGRGALQRELVACLLTGRTLRKPWARSRNKPQRHVTDGVVLSRHPAEAGDCAVAGHWEGDLIIGTGKSAIGTVLERGSRATLLVHLPRLEGFGNSPDGKNGPALACHGAEAMNIAPTATLSSVPRLLRETLTRDPGQGIVRVVCLGPRGSWIGA